ncbi:MAG: hypothetical protein RSA05_05155 [Cetobacterium sp.]
MSQELRMVEQNRYDDEIDLYELIEILVRNKKTVFVTFILCFLISLGAALYVRSNREDYLVKNILIEQSTHGLKGVNIIEVGNLFLKDENVKRFYEIEGLNKAYLKKTPEKSQGIESKRKFLQEVVTVSNDNKNPGSITIKTKIIDNEQTGREMVNTYVSLLKEQDNLKIVVGRNIKRKTNQLAKTKINLKELENRFLEIFKNDADVRALNPTEKVQYIQYKYPALSLRRMEEERYYVSYMDELVKLNAINTDVETIKMISDTYFVKGQTKAKLILAVGAVMGVFLGIMMAFLKEFIDGYKKRYQKVK